MTQQGIPMRALISVLKLAGSGNTQPFSISQDFAFCKIYISDPGLSLSEVSPH